MVQWYKSKKNSVLRQQDRIMECLLNPYRSSRKGAILLKEKKVK